MDREEYREDINEFEKNKIKINDGLRKPDTAQWVSMQRMATNIGVNFYLC